jgi:hypothetical protein
MSKEEWTVGILLAVLFIGGYFLLMWLAPEWVGISSRADKLDKELDRESDKEKDGGSNRGDSS